MRKSTKSAVVAGTVLALTGGGVAFAYWTTSGSGTSTATTGTTSDWGVVVTNQDTAALSPNGPSNHVTFTITNNGTGVQKLQDVTATVATSNGTPWSVAGCSWSDYAITNLAVAKGDVAGGGVVSGSFDLQMVDTGANQDGCKNASVPLYVHAS